MHDEAFTHWVKVQCHATTCRATGGDRGQSGDAGRVTAAKRETHVRRPEIEGNVKPTHTMEETFSLLEATSRDLANITNDTRWHSKRLEQQSPHLV